MEISQNFVAFSEYKNFNFFDLHCFLGKARKNPVIKLVLQIFLFYGIYIL